MTARNAVLLIIKQNQGIEYNALLNKIAPNYSTLNSARAALSRTLKDLRAFGLVTKQGNNLFITDKAAGEISSEMKSKLLLRLNQLVRSKHAPLSLNQIVELLHALIERSKTDPDLLKAAKGSTEFTVSELTRLNQKISSQVEQLTKVLKVFADQILALKSLDFHDARRLDLNQVTIHSIVEVANKLAPERVTLESENATLLDQLSAATVAKPKGNTLSLELKELPGVVESLARQVAEGKKPYLSLYFPGVKALLDANGLEFSGPYSRLNSLLGE